MKNDFWTNVYSGTKLEYENWKKNSKTKSKLIYGALQPDATWKPLSGNHRMATMCVTNPNKQPISMKPPPEQLSTTSDFETDSETDFETDSETSTEDSSYVNGTNMTISEMENIFQNFNFQTGWFQTYFLNVS